MPMLRWPIYGLRATGFRELAVRLLEMPQGGNPAKQLNRSGPAAPLGASAFREGEGKSSPDAQGRTGRGYGRLRGLDASRSRLWIARGGSTQPLAPNLPESEAG
jgi:hypothetical protein